MRTDAKLKTALDESRLLILGAQVLFGFQFEAAFQKLFSDLPAQALTVYGVGLAAMVISICLLIAPSLHQQILYHGQASAHALAHATQLTSFALLPLTLGLSASAYVAIGRLSDWRIGAFAAAGFLITSLALLYGLGFVMRKHHTPDAAEPSSPTPLRTRIDQMLTEARVIIPGGQALLGFQLICTLTAPFAELPGAVQAVHVAGLCCVALAVIMLMTPAAVHRIAFQGDDSAQFYRLGSIIVVSAALPLACGVAVAIFVVCYKVADSMLAAIAAGAVSFMILVLAWLILPLALRNQRSGQGATKRTSNATT